MKRILFLLAFLLSVFFASAQQPDTTHVFQKINVTPGYEYNGVRVKLQFTPPNNDTTYKLAVKDSGSITYWHGTHWKWTGHAWAALSGSGAIDSVKTLNDSTLRIYSGGGYVDGYLPGINRFSVSQIARDSLSGGTGITYNSTTGVISSTITQADGSETKINPGQNVLSITGVGTNASPYVVNVKFFCDSVTRSNDTVFNWIGGVRQFAFKLPTGGTTITNASGSGDTLLISNTIKRLEAGYGITNTPSSTKINQKLDTATVFPAIRATIPSSAMTLKEGFSTIITGEDTINYDPRSYANLVYDHFLGTSLSTNWTNSAPNTTVTVANGYLSLVGGSSADIITNSFSSILHRWTYELKTVIQSIGAGDYFLFSVNDAANGLSVVCRVKFSDLSGNWYYSNTSNPLGTTAAQGTTSIGDTVYLRLKRDNFTLTYEVENHTKGTTKNSSFTFDFIQAAGSSIIPFRAFNITLNPFAGSIDIDYARLLNQERVDNDFMIIGHSIAEGFDAVSADSTFYNRLQNYFPQHRFSLFARSGSTVLNYNNTYKDQLIVQQPKNVIILLGINEVNTGITSSAFIANMHTLIDTLDNYNINTKICYVTPYNAAHKDTIIAFNNALIAAFPSSQLINIYDTLEVNGLMQSSSDSLHPNAAGHRYMFNVLKNYIDTFQNSYIRLTGPYTYDHPIYSNGLQSSGRQSDLGIALKLNIGASGNDYPSLAYNVNFQTSGSTYKYRNSDYSSLMEIGAGLNYYNVAAPGTSGNTISYGLPKFAIGTDGNVGFGVGGPDTYLHIKKSQAGKTTIGNSVCLNLDNTSGNPGERQEIGMGYKNGNAYSSTIIGSIETSGAGFTNTDFYIGLRDGTGNDPAIERFRITNTGNVGIGISSPTARLHLPAGTATANTAPLKFTSGTNLTSPEAGAVEFDGTNYFVTSSTTRYTLAKTLTDTASLDFPSTAGSSSSDLTITVTGAADGDVVSLGVQNVAIPFNGYFIAWVSATNTVTVKFVNNSLSPSDPTSGTFRVSVFKY